MIWQQQSKFHTRWCRWLLTMKFDINCKFRTKWTKKEFNKNLYFNFKKDWTFLSKTGYNPTCKHFYFDFKIQQGQILDIQLPVAWDCQTFRNLVLRSQYIKINQHLLDQLLWPGDQSNFSSRELNKGLNCVIIRSYTRLIIK